MCEKIPYTKLPINKNKWTECIAPMKKLKILQIVHSCPDWCVDLYGIVRDTSTTFLFDECVKCKINKIRLESFGMNCWVWKVNKIDTRFRVIFCCCFFFFILIRWSSEFWGERKLAHTQRKKKKRLFIIEREKSLGAK